MKERILTVLRRRDLLHAMITGAAAAAGITAVVLKTTAAKPSTTTEKRGARYQPNSAEVRNFYRVNRYPTQ